MSKTTITISMEELRTLIAAEVDKALETRKTNKESGLLENEICGRDKVQRALGLWNKEALKSMAELGILGKALWLRGKRGNYVLDTKKGVARYRYYMKITERERDAFKCAGAVACENRWLDLERRGEV